MKRKPRRRASPSVWVQNLSELPVAVDFNGSSTGRVVTVMVGETIENRRDPIALTNFVPLRMVRASNALKRLLKTKKLRKLTKRQAERISEAQAIQRAKERGLYAGRR